MTTLGKKSAKKGSKYQLQYFVNCNQIELNKKIKKATGIDIHEWISPIKLNDFYEYGDEKFRALGYFSSIIEENWKEFWPLQGGPSWDGIAFGKKGDIEVICLVEAKSYPKEMESKCKAVSPESIETILRTLREYINDNFELENTNYYQLANRIAFTKFINNRLKSQSKEAYLLLINFYDDNTHTNLSNVCDLELIETETERVLQILESQNYDKIVKVYLKGSNKVNEKKNEI
jgi:hypothetical protein